MEINNDHHNCSNEKTALVIVNNEIILSALKKVIENLGYQVRQNIEFWKEAEFGFIGAYFAYLGIFKQLRRVNPSLPLVLVINADQESVSDPRLQSLKDFYDVITLDGCDEADIRQKTVRWFFEGQGKFLLKKGSADAAEPLRASEANKGGKQNEKSTGS